MKRMNRSTRVEQRRDDARRRQEDRATRSTGEQLSLLSRRPGESQKERAKLEAALAMEQSEVGESGGRRKEKAL